MADWSDTPPTVPGCYWVRGYASGEEWPSRLYDDGSWDHHVGEAQFGSRIPSNAELLAMQKQIATLTEHRHAQYREMHEVEAVLGKALMYPYIYIDPVTNMVVSPEFPGAVKTDDICIGDHVTVSLAMEAARKIATLTAERDAAEAELEAATQRLIDQEVA